ncbi:MAG: hypothetical protein LBP73_02715 [Clostridiales Family XIII bacterium]|jgi:hypothetical protein|nr:hypothetical protein [Clostridiales Family XIII bacterium]
MTRKGLYALSTVIYLVLMGLITIPPVTQALDRVSPRILGFPFFQFFLVLVPVLMAVWLVVWFLWECKIDDANADRSKEKGGDVR